VLHHNISIDADDEYDDDDDGDEILNGIKMGAPRRIAGSRRVMRRMGTATPSPTSPPARCGQLDTDVTMGDC